MKAGGRLGSRSPEQPNEVSTSALARLTFHPNLLHSTHLPHASTLRSTSRLSDHPRPQVGT